MWRPRRKKVPERSHGEIKIESDELFQLRRRMTDLEQRYSELEMMCQLLYNAGPGQPTQEVWKDSGTDSSA